MSRRPTGYSPKKTSPGPHPPIDAGQVAQDQNCTSLVDTVLYVWVGGAPFLGSNNLIEAHATGAIRVALLSG